MQHDEDSLFRIQGARCCRGSSRKRCHVDCLWSTPLALTDCLWLQCPDNPWRFQNSALFVRLDSFLERCHDILELTNTVLQFSKLETVEVGGTKGKILTTSVAQIFNDFTKSVSRFHEIDYSLLDVEADKFDDDFYLFRVEIKELCAIFPLVSRMLSHPLALFGLFWAHFSFLLDLCAGNAGSGASLRKVSTTAQQFTPHLSCSIRLTLCLSVRSSRRTSRRSTST